MLSYAPITLRAVDNNGHQLFQYSVPFSFEVSVTQVMEQAFSLAQTSSLPDPFRYTTEYYGYNESAQFPGYIGYVIESIGGLPTNEQFYWELLINGVSSLTSAGTTYPGP